MSHHTASCTINGRELIIETGELGKQANGAALVRYGDTVVFAAATASKEDRNDVDFFPLTVDYRERTYAAGKIPGGFFKREGRPSEKEILTSRIIDRPIRPLFPESYRKDTQVLCTVLSADGQNDPDIVALIPFGRPHGFRHPILGACWCCTNGVHGRFARGESDL